MNDTKAKRDARASSGSARTATRRPFVKPQIERRAKLPKVTNGQAGTFEP